MKPKIFTSISQRTGKIALIGNWNGIKELIKNLNLVLNKNTHEFVHLPNTNNTAFDFSAIILNDEIAKNEMETIKKFSKALTLLNAPKVLMSLNHPYGDYALIGNKDGFNFLINELELAIVDKTERTNGNKYKINSKNIVCEFSSIIVGEKVTDNEEEALDFYDNFSSHV